MIATAGVARGAPPPRRFAALMQWGGAETAFFSLKCLVAATLAYYIALRIGLTRPYWAVTTSYIVAQPLAGAVLSKALFRVLGTTLGGVVAVLLVPTFVNEPAALCTAFALWLGLCLYLSLLDRTPRAYVFLLAGYTASIIGFPSVDAPGQIFDVALVRVQEIVIGILCGSLIHGTIFPRSVTGRLLQRIDEMLGDAERWSLQSLSGQTGETLVRERRRLALDLSDLHQLATHLPFDTASRRPRVRSVRAFQDQISLLLPLASAVEDRANELVRLTGVLPPDVAALIDRVAAWLAAGPQAPDHQAAADAMIWQAAALEPVIVPPLQWEVALRLSLVARLGELIATHRDARMLRDQIRAPTARPVSASVSGLLAQTRRRVLHLDRGIALRSALGTIATVLIGSALWIMTGWSEGGGAVTIAGVCCALFGSSAEPAPAVMRFFWGSLIGMVIAAGYVYAIFPAITEFPVLIAAIAPAALVLGAFLGQARPSFIALGAVLGLFNSLGLADRYSPDFAGFLNGSLAQLIGTLFAAVTVGLFQTIGSENSVARLMRASWRDLARRSIAPGRPDVPAWASRMLDRVGLIAPRLAALPGDPGPALAGFLADLRIGLAVAELRLLRLDATPDERASITSVLEDVSRHYRDRRYRPSATGAAGSGAPAPAAAEPTLLICIDTALRNLAYGPDPERRRRAVLALTSLRRNLFATAPALEVE